ncbi:MAG: hypothetical protein KAS16_01785 [Thermoplasmata archaeon]|nr:hypothetical protein [Thermoplasmata archaeon]
MKIEKRNGKTMEFNSMKLQHSIQSAGANRERAEEIEQCVSDKKCRTTQEIRAVVSKELHRTDPDTAKSYDDTRRLVANTATDTAMGVAMMSQKAMADLHLESGDYFTIVHGSQRERLEARKDDHEDKPWDEVRLHIQDLEAFGIQKGRNVIARKEK